MGSGDTRPFLEWVSPPLCDEGNGEEKRTAAGWALRSGESRKAGDEAESVEAGGGSQGKKWQRRD